MCYNTYSRNNLRSSGIIAAVPVYRAFYEFLLVVCNNCVALIIIIDLIIIIIYIYIYNFISPIW